MIWSVPTQTPTTTTRENIGASSMMLWITPGTPTHSKMTGCLGSTPSRSARRNACHQPNGSLLSFSVVPTASSSTSGMPFTWPLASAAVCGESSAGSTTTSAPHALASARRPAE